MPPALLDANRCDLVVPLDGVDDVHPFGDLPEHRVHAIEMALRRMTDEELAATGVLARMRHRECARDVFMRVLLRFAFDRVARTARAHGPFARLGVGVTALDHEVRNDTMKLGAVVEFGIRELLEIRYRAGDFVAEQLQLDRPSGRFHHRVEVLLDLRYGLHAYERARDVLAVERELERQLRRRHSPPRLLGELAHPLTEGTELRDVGARHTAADVATLPPALGTVPAAQETIRQRLPRDHAHIGGMRCR